MTVTVRWVDETGESSAAGEISRVPELLAAGKGTVWIDSDERNPELEKLLEQTLQVHPLVVEDVFSDMPTPKVEDYDSYLYVVMHALLHDERAAREIETTEIDLVIGKGWLFTHHEQAMVAVSSVADELRRNPRSLQRGAAYVAHAIIDRITDYYLPVADHFEGEVDEIESLVLDKPDPEVLQRLFLLKRSLQRLRRLSAYQRDLLHRLSRGEFELIPERALPFYRDVYDHFVRVADLADSYRELVTSAMEIWVSMTANRTNDVMKVLTMISTIMLPLSFIAGVYGMNFKHMPELEWPFGYPIAIGLMVCTALALTLFFRRKRWI